MAPTRSCAGHSLLRIGINCNWSSRASRYGCHLVPSVHACPTLMPYPTCEIRSDGEHHALFISNVGRFIAFLCLDMFPKLEYVK